MKDVLHWLDFWAAENPQRFIFSGLPALLKACNKRRVRNKLKPCSLSHLKHVFNFLRKWHVISPYFKTWDGRYGFVFEPHEARQSNEHGICIKHTQMDPYGALGEPPDGTRRSTQRAPLVAPQDVFGSTVGSTPRSTDDSAKTIDCVELTDEQVTKWIAENVQDGASKVLRLDGSKVKRLEGQKVIQEQSRENRDQNQQLVSEVFSSRKPNTAEATPKAKQPGRKRDVLPPDEFAAKKDADALEEIKADMMARLLCPKCGIKHLKQLGEECNPEPSEPTASEQINTALLKGGIEVAWPKKK